MTLTDTLNEQFPVSTSASQSKNFSVLNEKVILPYNPLPFSYLLIVTTEATIVLNAGGRVNKSITDLIFLDNFTRGQIKDVIVIHHTGKGIKLCFIFLPLIQYIDCGFTHNTDESVKSELKALHPPHLAKKIDNLYFGTFGSSDL